MLAKKDSNNLLRSLINVAEKASNIARLCRSNQELLSLLIQEKTGREANTRFDHDFKTLADVTIQEMVKHDIGGQFPELKYNIRGEECPKFTNQKGERCTIVIGENKSETADCLRSVMKGFIYSADALADEVHRALNYDDPSIGQLPELPTDLDYAKLGIWIDPIDATAEYIRGETLCENLSGISSHGLDCVTVLIGVYDICTLQPVIGVISQPFYKKNADNEYNSLICWGLALDNLRATNCPIIESTHSDKLAIFSSSENADILHTVSKMGYKLIYSAGAGHKALKVLTKEVDFYILTKDSTFKWDTCAPQAILRAMGGNIYDFKKSVSQCKPVPLLYIRPDDNDIEWISNKGGLIAARDEKLVEELIVNF